MKYLYKEQNTFRILPINFMHNLGTLIKWDTDDAEKFLTINAYYNWAMGHELSITTGQDLLKALILLGDKMNIQDYDARLEVWNKNNGK